MNTLVQTTNAQGRLRTLAMLFVALMLALSTLMLAGCGGSSADEQDNCYGEDMPVINE